MRRKQIAQHKNYTVECEGHRLRGHPQYLITKLEELADLALRENDFVRAEIFNQRAEFFRRGD